MVIRPVLHVLASGQICVLVISDCAMSICCVSLATSPLRSRCLEQVASRVENFFVSSSWPGLTLPALFRSSSHHTIHKGLGSLKNISLSGISLLMSSTGNFLVCCLFCFFCPWSQEDKYGSFCFWGRLFFGGGGALAVSRSHGIESSM